MGGFAHDTWNTLPKRSLFLQKTVLRHVEPINASIRDHDVQVFVGNLDSQVSEKDLKDEFRFYGSIRRLWIARGTGFGFVEFDDLKNALDAIRGLDGKNGWHVDLARSSWGGRGRGGCGRGGHSEAAAVVTASVMNVGSLATLPGSVGCSEVMEVREAEGVEVPVLIYRGSPSNGRR
uniref:RRM domain-containing protein n=1 Tax=Ananas comosus var. bracteatus TaxID=296719 RepID=A0A6V7QY37_ANACO